MLTKLLYLLASIYDRFSSWMSRRRQKKLEKFTYPTDRIVISCDASITSNPGGQASVGIVICIPGNEPIRFSRYTIGKTNNEAEYEAVFTAIENLATLYYRKCDLPVDIYSDSMLVVKQLSGEFSCKLDTLLKRRDACWEYFRLFPLVTVNWKRRNSTEDLKWSNDAAQKLLNVRQH